MRALQAVFAVCEIARLMLASTRFLMVAAATFSFAALMIVAASCDHGARNVLPSGAPDSRARVRPAAPARRAPPASPARRALPARRARGLDGRCGHGGRRRRRRRRSGGNRRQRRRRRRHRAAPAPPARAETPARWLGPRRKPGHQRRLLGRRQQLARRERHRPQHQRQRTLLRHQPRRVDADRLGSTSGSKRDAQRRHVVPDLVSGVRGVGNVTMHVKVGTGGATVHVRLRSQRDVEQQPADVQPHVHADQQHINTGIAFTFTGAGNSTVCLDNVSLVPN